MTRRVVAALELALGRALAVELATQGTTRCSRKAPSTFSVVLFPHEGSSGAAPEPSDRSTGSLVLPVFAAAAMLSWCLARPPLKCVREGARFLKTQEPSNVTDRKAAVVEIAVSEVGPHLVEHLREAKILGSKPACQGPRTNPQRLCDLADASLAVRQKRQ